MKPAVKTFTRDNPCTKLDLWNCFRDRSGFQPVQVDEALSQIGKNAPRVMERNGYLVRESTAKGDFYRLTAAGRDWLDKGFRSFLRNHPHRKSEAKFVSVPHPEGRVRRVRNG